MAGFYTFLHLTDIIAITSYDIDWRKFVYGY